MRYPIFKFIFVSAVYFTLVTVTGCATATKEEPPPAKAETKPVETAPPAVTAPPVEAPKAQVAPAKTTTQYTVKRGDNLWTIAAQPAIYHNALQWPLIYKANSGAIQDADLIQPGQRLNIDLQPSAAEVSAAILHAKTRGPWRLGVVEDSDRVYLGK